MLSIVITNYNYGRFLERCVRSCHDQKNIELRDIECVIVDDKSSDNSRQIIQDIIKNYPKLDLKVIFNEKNSGLPFSRNVGIKKSKHRYVTFLDADDYLHENFSFMTTSFMKMNPSCACVAADYVTVDSDEKHIERKYHPEEPIACGIVFKKQLFYDIGLYDESFLMCEEEELMHRIKTKNNNSVKYLEMPLYRYRKHESNITNNKKEHLKYKEKLKEKIGDNS